VLNNGTQNIKKKHMKSIHYTLEVTRGELTEGNKNKEVDGIGIGVGIWNGYPSTNPVPRGGLDNIVVHMSGFLFFYNHSK